jgi:3D (Asp-Asp-Asp) domain-containing protein
MSPIARLFLVCSFLPALGATAQAQSADTFSLPAPKDGAIQENLSLWATWYYTPHFDVSAGGLPLLDMDGNAMGPRLKKYDWCHAALEGSLQVTDASGRLQTYNYAGVKEPLQADCSEFFKYRVGTIRYRHAFGPYGDGADETSYILSPYRSLAVDKTWIPYGSVVYIPAARGQKVTLPDGRTMTHDGYFFAVDKGGAIKENHIDVFIGTNNKNPFGWIGSAPSETFDAHIINDANTRSTLEALHARP